MDPEEIKPDWKDFLAMVLATYQLILLPVLAIIALAAMVIYGFSLLLR